jgi:hypothetical protein
VLASVGTAHPEAAGDCDDVTSRCQVELPGCDPVLRQRFSSCDASFARRSPSTGTVGTAGGAMKTGTGPFTDDRPRQVRVCCSLRERPCRGDAGGIRRRTPSGYRAPWST